jgi:hypothetical protein
MSRRLAGLLAFFLPWYFLTPCMAGCSNYTDGSMPGPAPKAILCYKGVCDPTTVNDECSNIYSTHVSYANGLILSAQANGPVVFENKYKKMNGRDWICIEVTDDACEPLWDADRRYKLKAN